MVLENNFEVARGYINFYKSRLFRVKFRLNKHMAYTLLPGDVNVAFMCDKGDYNNAKKNYSRTHDDGWTIEGKIHEDYYEWVNNFKAEHPDYGRVGGDFETEVFATSKEAFKHFFANHPPNYWDYWDI